LSKIKLIYILGSSRCGSTLLDLILGSHSSIISTGEIWRFRRNFKNNSKCSCRRNIPQCPFWIPIINKLNKKDKKFFSDIYLDSELKSTSRLSKIKTLINGNFSSIYSPVEIQNYSQREFLLFQTILEESGKSIILDSSKYLERLLKLYYSGYFDIKIIHLVRDGRAYIDSARRSAKRETTSKKSANILIDMIQWRVRLERQIRFLSQVKKENYIRINYRFLAEHPSETMNFLCKSLGVEFEREILNISSDKYVFKQQHHIIGGNRVKWSSPDTKIEYKNQWINNLSSIDKFIFTALGGKITNHKLGIE